MLSPTSPTCTEGPPEPLLHKFSPRYGHLYPPFSTTWIAAPTFLYPLKVVDHLWIVVVRWQEDSTKVIDGGDLGEGDTVCFNRRLVSIYNHRTKEMSMEIFSISLPTFEYWLRFKILLMNKILLIYHIINKGFTLFGTNSTFRFFIRRYVKEIIVYS